MVAHDHDPEGDLEASESDGKEGVASFLEKRDPAYSGKASELPPFYPWQEPAG